MERLGKFHGKFLVLVCCGVDVLRVGTSLAVCYCMQEDEPRIKKKKKKVDPSVRPSNGTRRKHFNLHYV